MMRCDLCYKELSEFEVRRFANEHPDDNNICVDCNIDLKEVLSHIDIDEQDFSGLEIYFDLDDNNIKWPSDYESGYSIEPFDLGSEGDDDD